MHIPLLFKAAEKDPAGHCEHCAASAPTEKEPGAQSEHAASRRETKKQTQPKIVSDIESGA
eukprot:2034546-Rhodomonas_salina.3